jgi:preprotein translocase subunit SecG
MLLNNFQEVRIVTVLKTILTIVFIILSVVITVVILMQEGKSAGLGAISGAADTYWGKNKGRSMEGILVKLTRIAVILFLLLAVVLNMGIW